MGEPAFRSVNIDRFRGIYHLELAALSRINVIVGANNTGKSSVLEAVALCCDPVNVEHWVAVAQGREVRPVREPLLQSARWMFRHDASLGGPQVSTQVDLHFERAMTPPRWHVCMDMSRRLEVGEGPEGPGSEPVETAFVRLTLEPTPASPTTPLRQQQEFTIRSRGSTALPTPVRASTYVPSALISPVTHRAETFQIQALSSLNTAEHRERIIELLRLFDPDIQNVELVDPTGARSTVRVWHKQTGAAPVSSLGDGFRRVLTYALAVVQCQNGVLLVDEVETAIHYRAQREVARWMFKACEQYNV